MSQALAVTAASLAALAAAVVLLRVVSRHRSTACPAWLTVLLENPYMNTVAGSRVLLDRAGVREGTEVLDVGAGPGRLAIPAAERVGSSGRLVALDIQPAMIARLEERLADRRVRNVETILGGIGDRLLPRDRFHCALLVTVLGEIPDQLAALREIHDALRPGGVLSITEVIPDPHYQSRRRVKRLASAAGFELARSFGSWWAFTLNFVRDPGKRPEDDRCEPT